MKKSFNILGISAYYHDSSAVLLKDGKIVAAAQEERFTRIKHDAAFPLNAIRYVIEEGMINVSKDLDAIIFYEKPLLKFERLLETYHAFAPKGLISFLRSMPAWIKQKLFQKRIIRKELLELGISSNVPLLFSDHHLSHAASSFFPSPFNDAAILTLDGVGEWSTLTIGYGKGNKIELLKNLDFPHSLGLFYSSVTYYCGFKVNSGEYKLMGLAPYGDPYSEQTKLFKEKILTHIIDVRCDGSFLLNMKYFDFATGLKMTNNRNWNKLFGFPGRGEEDSNEQKYMNLALAAQQVTEDIIIKLARTAKKITGSKNLVLAGGVALNCVANGHLSRKEIFDSIWIQPASGDAGGALGGALAAWHMHYNKERIISNSEDKMEGALLGPKFSDDEIGKVLRKYEANYFLYNDEQEMIKKVANLIARGNVIGWFQGRMEFGPRALGNRSILGDARNSEMQKKMNLKIKFREGFRPFAPCILEDDIENYLAKPSLSPYMLFVSHIKEDLRKDLPPDYNQRELFDKLYFKRSDLPAITHVDFSARVQTVSKKINPKLWRLLTEFKKETNFGVLINTSFNVRGEPVVCTPEDAMQCFMRTEMDYLVMNNFLLEKENQMTETFDLIPKKEYALD